MGGSEEKPEEGAFELRWNEKELVMQGSAKNLLGESNSRYKGPGTGTNITYFDGAAHEGGSLYGLPKHPQQVPRGLLELDGIGYTSGEVLKALHCIAPR